VNKILENYFKTKDWTFKLRNGEYALDLCPICNAGPGHFYINELKEVFYCQKCGQRGHLLSLKKRLGDLPPISHVSEYSKTKIPPKTIDLAIIEKYHKDLLDTPEALSYLMDERSFTLETIKTFKLGLKDGTIVIPYFEDHLCLGIKYRGIKEKTFYREEGCPSILFNVDQARKYQGSVILSEGEFDAIAYDQVGFPNVVSVPNGAESFSDEWIDYLEQSEQIYLSYDMDEAGRRGVEKVADKLGRHRCWDVLLPLKDAGDCLKAGFTNVEMSDILAKAKRFESKLVKRPDDFFEMLLQRHETPLATRTGWTSFDDLLGGIRPNELTVVTGETSSGKTTWGVNLCYRLLTQEDTK
jgi:hypothetical protein